jgi:putative GTP pyrophosphokinase
MQTKEKDGPSTNHWCHQYERARPDYLRFTSKIESLLSDMLQAKGIDHHLIESRTKDLESFREKIVRSSKSYKNPLDELTDLSGLRVITHYQDDAILVADLIRAEFEVDSANSIDHSPEDAEFGYRSAHCVVRISETRAQLVEWVGLAGLRAEIQVRTVLQHSWAAISHKLQYKRENDVPTSLRRKLFRLSALFELADDEFVSLRDASGLLSQQIDKQLANGNHNIQIDHISLSQFIEHSPIIAELCDMAADAGFSFDSQYADDSRDRVSDLVQLSKYAKLNTLAQFEGVLKGSLPWARKYLSQQYIQGQNSGSSEWYASPAFICSLVFIKAILSHIRPAYVLKFGWDRSIASRVFKVAKTFNQD